MSGSSLFKLVQLKMVEEDIGGLYFCDLIVHSNWKGKRKTQ